MEIEENIIPVNFKPSLLLWIDGRDGNSAKVREHERLSDVARESQIPFREIHANRLTSTDICHLFASLTKLKTRIGSQILGIGGHYLEDQVSRCCLQALAIGYDTHLLCDATFAFDTTLKHYHLARLTQAGVVPSSLHQMITFLIADEQDNHVVDNLRRHIKL